MQLVFNIDTDVNIQRNMTAIEQESLSLPEKFTNKEIIEKGNDDSVNVANENSIINTSNESRPGDEDIKSENISIENLDNSENRDSNKKLLKNNSVELLSLPMEKVSTHSLGSNITTEILKEKEHNKDHKIILDYEGDKETNTNLRNLESRVEKNETNIEIKVDIEVKKGSHENEQKIDPKTLSVNKENSDNNVGMITSTLSASEGTPITEETNTLNSVIQSKDSIDIETNVELDMEMEICEETGKNTVTEEIDFKSVNENKEENLHGVESFYDNNAEIDKILEESIMEDSDEIDSDNIVFKQKESIDENLSTVEMKSNIELCETESSLKLSNPIKNKTLEIESRLTSCEEVYSGLHATSNLEKSPAISTEVYLKEDVIKIKDKAVKRKKEDIRIDITDEIDTVNKDNYLKGDISDDTVEVNKQIGEIDINTSDNLNNINEITVEKEPVVIEIKKLGIFFEESAMEKVDETNVNKVIKGRELSEEIIELNEEIGETDGKACDKENNINEIAVEEEPKMIQVKELDIIVDESAKVTIDEKMEDIEVNEPDLLHEEIGKINDVVIKVNNIVMEEKSQIIQTKELEINVDESSKVTSDDKMEVLEVNEPDLLQAKEIRKINDEVSKMNNIVVDEESQMIQSTELDINVVESTKVTSDEKMKVIEVSEPDTLQEEEISKINDEVTKMNNVVVEDESLMIQSIELDINVVESTKMTSDETMEVIDVSEPDSLQEEEISKINDEVTKMNNVVVEDESLMIQSTELDINVVESTKVTSDEKMEVIDVSEPDSLQEKEISKINDEVTKMNNVVVEDESLMIQSTELDINVVESTKATSDEKMEIIDVSEPDSLQEEEISKINDEVTKMNNIVVEEESLMIQSIELDINVVESTKVTSDEKMEVIEVCEPGSLQEEEINQINVEVTKTNDIVVEEETQLIQSKELEINPQESAKVTPDKNMELIEFNEPNLVQNEKVSSTNQVVIDVEEQAIKDLEKNKDKSSNFVDNVIIDIADEIFDIKEFSETLSDSSNKLASNEIDIENNDFECEKTKVNKETENRNLNLKGESGTKIKDDEKITDIENHVQNFETSKPVEKKKLSHICKLSNTLDILSDEEEDSQNVSISFEKDCINIEDDDDIVLIDEGTTKDDCKYTENNKNEIKVSVEHNNTNINENVAMDHCEIITDNFVELGILDAEVTEKELQEQEPVEKELEKPMCKIPILPKTYLKTCKKSLPEMTRDELEEFCIMKIGESVIDRSNLNEIITQLQIVTTNMEEYKKRVNALMKQNRDLQVIVKSVLEEQKNGSNTPITPLKITRSVGMQVLMTDKPTERKKGTVGNSFQSFSPNRVHKRQTNQNLRTTKLQTNPNQQIPVPRLVPAVNSTSSSSNKTAPAAPTKIQGGPVPNGVWNCQQIQKPEKRKHSKVQNSVTVDLTDDEPPAKIIQRTVTPPVRLIPQQTLLAAQRPQFANNNNSPKKVYIPIGAAQNQVRPGHTIMLKQVPQGQRLRTPNILPKPSVARPLRITRLAPKHPAPLPDTMKQYQPPNWKALPPAPELKLSKVDNGIVISWKINNYQEDEHEEIVCYQIYAYQESSSPPNTALWKKIGDVKALPLPMACTLTQFLSGYKYYFSVRAIDIRSRLGPFSLPGSILLLNKM